MVYVMGLVIVVLAVTLAVLWRAYMALAVELVLRDRERMRLQERLLALDRDIRAKWGERASATEAPGDDREPIDALEPHEVAALEGWTKQSVKRAA